MSQIARKCVPFTPFEGELSRATVAIVSSAGVHRKDQTSFNIADELGDLTFRIIAGDINPTELSVTHHHYDHSDADADINIVSPLSRCVSWREKGLLAR
jgi:D-proline reductase (dithiol) PrdB